ncbi:TetR/AcrR family transcriptional regulator [Isoptericola chiayiensis]|uniref:TetR/AcrR family transcriptional regulator n=1 Tax=Isoptericola chiayiensis TaxID=579446 RepID=A0ABP8Y295_9MICO|nr:TetR/AcrR family transcriptional regulator [Isoptericola chiayiensis]NOV99557.1 AcrR family transcriptional regulator [Isoptericola chiayiensis]
MTARTARERARESITREILDAARARLAADGPAALSLRAVARDVGMVSSAVYRYFPSRDALLTRLLVECYDELGDVVEHAETEAPRADHAARWLATCRAARQWCVTHPGEFALLYGTPVPGYAAPQDTIEPAIRVVLLLARIAAEAQGEAAPVVSEVAPLVAGARDVVVQRGWPEPPPEVVARVLMAWTGLFGTVSFELFGHLNNAVSDPADWFDAVVARLGADAGIRPAATP